MSYRPHDKRPLGNTGCALLALAHERVSGITALEAVNARYPQSRQPLKKAKTFYGYLMRMTREGLLVATGNTRARYTEVRFTITAEGQRAGKLWWEHGAFPPQAAAFPRLAK